MTGARWAGIILLAVLYVWLCQYLIRFGGGFTLKNLFICVASGIVIFVPLYKRYIKAKQ